MIVVITTFTGKLYATLEFLWDARGNEPNNHATDLGMRTNWCGTLDCPKNLPARCACRRPTCSSRWSADSVADSPSRYGSSSAAAVSRRASACAAWTVPVLERATLHEFRNWSDVTQSESRSRVLQKAENGSVLTTGMGENSVHQTSEAKVSRKQVQ